MATKNANVTVCVQPEIKRQAEAVLDKLGLPVSVLIDTLYRQIIMTDEQFNVIMEKGYHQAKTGEGVSVDEAFTRIREGI